MSQTIKTACDKTLRCQMRRYSFRWQTLRSHRPSSKKFRHRRSDLSSFQIFLNCKIRLFSTFTVCAPIVPHQRNLGVVVPIFPRLRFFFLIHLRALAGLYPPLFSRKKSKMKQKFVKFLASSVHRSHTTKSLPSPPTGCRHATKKNGLE